MKDYRRNLEVMTEQSKNPNIRNITSKGKHAHHIGPQEFAGEFAEAGIDVNDPHLLTWLEESAHGKLHGGGYNAAWKRFFDNNENEGKEQIVDELVKMIKEHNFVVPGLFT